MSWGGDDLIRHDQALFEEAHGHDEPGPRSEPGPVVASFPEPEDRGDATLSDLGEVEYVEDLIRPGRIVVHAATEGSGKSYAEGELSIRIAVAGGAFAGTWPVLVNGPVLVMSEMHADDDFVREAAILGTLGRTRDDLRGRYYRLPLLTAAGGPPALMVPEWRAWITTWLRDRGAVLLVVDTATGATQVDPWGKAIQQVYADLRLMLAEYPALAIVLVVHLRKADRTGRGKRDIGDVMGEWGRWADVVMLQENDGESLEFARLSVRKRVRRERRILVTKRNGLVVDPRDLDEAAGPKVAPDTVMAAIDAQPGITYAELGKVLGVSKDTASNYVRGLGSLVVIVEGKNRAKDVHPAPGRSVLGAEAPNGAERAASVPGEEECRSTEPTLDSSVLGSSVPGDGSADASWDPEMATDDDGEVAL